MGGGEVGVAAQLCDSSPSPSLEQLERQVSQAENPEDIETAVEQLYQAVPRQHHLQHASRVSMGYSGGWVLIGSKLRWAPHGMATE